METTTPHHTSNSHAPQMDVRDIRAPGDAPGITCPGYGIDIRYINGFSVPIHIVQRSGMRFTIPPNSTGDKRELIIRVKIRLGRNVKIDMAGLLDEGTPSSDALKDVIDRVTKEGKLEVYPDEEAISLDYFVNEEEYHRSGGNLYIRNFDVLTSVLNAEHMPAHPFSHKGERDAMLYADQHVNDPNAFAYAVRIVDNHSCYGQRFVNINGDVYKVPTMKDPSLSDGVYVVSSGAVTIDHGYSIPASQRYSFEEADEQLGLYRSIEEARTLGDVIGQKEKELKELGVWVRQEEHRIKQERMHEEENLRRERVQEEEAIKKKRAAEEEELKRIRLKEEEALRDMKLEEEERLRKMRIEEDERVKQNKIEEAERVRQVKLEEDERQRRIKEEDDARNRRIKEEEDKRRYDEAERKRQEEERKRQEEAREWERKLQREREEDEYKRNKHAEEQKRREEIAEHERHLKRLKEEEAEIEHRRKMEDIKRKDEYDKRALERKETSELVKFLPTIITGIFAVAMVFTKFKK